jgi:hypothetical protein
MVALALATVMVLAAFVPLMGMANADNDLSVGGEDDYNIRSLPIVPGRIGVEAKWETLPDWTNRSQKAEAELGMELWEVSKTGMEPRYSFCAELGSPQIDLEGYQLDLNQHGLEADQIEMIIAALDYVYDKYGFTWGVPLDYIDEFGKPVYKNVRTPEQFGYAVAQLAVWSIVEIELEGVRGSTGIETYWDVFGDALQDVLDNCLAAYNAKQPTDSRIVDLVFLCPSYSPKLQLQLYPVFGEREVRDGDGTLIIGKQMGKKASYGSVTGGDTATAVPNAKGKYDHASYVGNLDTSLGKKGNWFQYNTVADITVGGTFDLVTGDKLKKVGEYDIVLNADGSFTITLRPNDALVASGAKFSISNEVVKKVKNKNDLAKHPLAAKNPIWTSAPGQQQFGFSGHSCTFNAAWVDVSKPVFVYIHLSLNGYEDTSVAGGEGSWDFLVTGPSFPNGTIVNVKTNGFQKLEKLKAGVYTIEELAPGWEASYSLNGGVFVTVNEFEVTVTDFNTQTVNVKNKEVPFKGKVAVQKLVENHQHDFVPAAGFLFAAYAVDVNGDPVGEPIAFATSDANGFAFFAASADFVVGKSYYIVELMTPEQEFVYKAAVPGVLVQAINEKDNFGDVPEFKNDLNFGVLALQLEFKVVEQRKISGGTIAGGDLTSDRVVQGSWQRAKLIDVDAILAGESFTANLVTGFNLTPCGTYTISASGTGGLFVELNFYPGIKANAVTSVV